jgi:hypothetical protein
MPPKIMNRLLANTLQNLIPSFSLSSYKFSSEFYSRTKEIAARYLLLAINQKKQAGLKNE